MFPGVFGKTTPGGAAYRDGRKIRPDERGMRPQPPTGGGTDAEPAAAYPNMPVLNMVDPFIGNNKQLLASQLSAGFGASPDQYMSQMSQVYRPMHSVGLFEPLTETKNALEDGDYDMTGTTGLLALDRVLGFDVPGANVNVDRKNHGLLDSPEVKRKLRYNQKHWDNIGASMRGEHHD